MASIDKRDKVNIYASSTLSIDDFASLSLLYQPLIGAKALGIYELMYSLLDRQTLCADTLIYSNILDLLGVNNSTFEDSRLKLEGIGLLETFNKNDCYTFLIKQPLTPARFLVDTVFGAYLLSAVGEDMFKVLTDRFKIQKFDRTGYDNITARFDQVYETVESDIPNINGFLLTRKPNSSVEIVNHAFDFDFFLSQIDESFLEYGMTPQIKKQIINTSYVYGFDENDMAMLYSQSIGRNGYFDSTIFKRKATLLNKHEGAEPRAEVKGDLTEDEFYAMNCLCNYTVKDIFDKFWPNYPPAWLTTTTNLFQAVELERGVVNILVFYVLKKKGGVLPSLEYLKKVAATWNIEGITTREKAWAYVRNLKNEEKPTGSYSGSKAGKVKGNEYSTNYLKNLKEEMEEL